MIQKILVTGNMGYVGPVVVRRLRNSYPQARITGLDVGYFAHCLTTRGLLPETRVDVQHFMDIRDVDSAVLEGVDAVVHLAALSNDALGKAYDLVTSEVNFLGTVQLARLAKRMGARSFVFASSCSTYGFSHNGVCTEDSPLNPLTSYARSKIMAEEGLRPLAEDDFLVTCFRFATACGMSERLRLDLVLNDLVHSALTKKRIDVLSDGTPWRPLIHVKDMAQAMDWGIRRSVHEGGKYLVVNAGSDEWNYQIRDLAYAVRKHFPEADVSINTKASADRRSYRVGFERFRTLAPDHQPQMTLDGAIRELSEGLQSLRHAENGNGMSHLSRLNVLSHLDDHGYCRTGIRLEKNYA